MIPAWIAGVDGCLVAVVDIFPKWYVSCTMARTSTTDVFNAVAGSHRREILDVLVGGEKAVGSIVSDLSMSQPQVSKHLRVLSEAGLVRCRAEGRRRLYRLDPAHLRPLREWMAKYEQVMEERLDQMDVYLNELQSKERASA
jgi:DNA-binding transcriptional ArsR family regulator